MKDYLNSTEKLNLMAVLRVSKELENFLKGNLFTKEEKTDIKKSITFITRAIIGKKEPKTEEDKKYGLLNRLNKDAVKSFFKALEKVKVFTFDKSKMDSYQKKVNADLNAAYEENKDYFRLVELIMFYNCRNCTKCGNECEFYKEFEAKHLPEFDGVERCGDCKYSYKE